MNQATGTINNAGDCKEDQESSSTQEMVINNLTSFREQWQRELQSSSKRSPVVSKSQMESSDIEIGEESTNESKAKALFIRGIEYEKTGKLYEAIKFYRRAVQLEPDIELRLYESTKAEHRDRNDEDEQVTGTEANEYNSETGEEVDRDAADCNILTKLSRIVQRNQCVCFPNFEQSTTHFSSLPTEIVLYILRWVVSSDLDLRSLEQVTLVCRGLYVCGRDPEIWRMACARVWGVNCGRIEPNYKSWREMYLTRPRLRYNGCYISKTTYIRAGENSFQDQYYQPWHLVEYYRYLRFFPEGNVLMLTCNEGPQSSVNSLRSRQPRNPNILIGHYRLHDNRVTLVLKRQEVKSNSAVINRRRKKAESLQDSGEQTFHAEFEIQSHHKRRNSQLSWLCYSVYTRYKNGQEGNSRLSLGGRYPPFRFSRVKSYTQESESPLQ